MGFHRDPRFPTYIAEAWRGMRQMMPTWSLTTYNEHQTYLTTFAKCY